MPSITARRLHLAAGTLAIAASLALAGCGNSSTPASPLGVVVGTALAGPTCPVERPGDPLCAPRPVTGTVELRQQDRVVATAAIDTAGSFSATVPAGRYTVAVDVGSNLFPTCPAVEVTVVAGATATVEVQCDTGIR
ncbi:unannotated protein [freshwater metagenome]|uniref:Unannotated protein n=1 Tax=freshwater metagenome TaxID=449393 RepID=A0A6J7CQ20_9ZZZZ|nr:hypothetical protein [Actinomycetota bacterium]